ncbi:hypothetical protein QJQ45_022299, partial [Haematococcus lacustris]
MTPRGKRGQRTAEGQHENTRGAELGAGQASYSLALPLPSLPSPAPPLFSPAPAQPSPAPPQPSLTCVVVHEQQQQQAVVHEQQCKNSNIRGVCLVACKLISRQRSGMVCSRLDANKGMQCAVVQPCHCLCSRIWTSHWLCKTNP